MKKRLIVYCFLAFIGLFLIGYQYWSLQGVTFANFERIRLGTSFDEVQGLMGGQIKPIRYGTPIKIPNQGCVEYWHGRSGTIIVFYDARGIVGAKEWDDRWNRKPLWEHILDSVLPVQEVRE